MEGEPGRDLLSTGAAARVLGSSRQHVVDLCTRGDLPYVWAGRHRRIPKVALDGLRPADPLTRDQERSLWLHRAVLGTLMAEPQKTVELARNNATRVLERQSRSDMTSRWLEEWLRVLDGNLDDLAEILTSRSPHARELRQNSPFAGALSSDVRSQVLRAFAQHWREEHAVARRPRPGSAAARSSRSYAG